MINIEDYSKSFKLTYKLFPKWIQWFYDCIPDSRRENSCNYPMGEVTLLGLSMFLFRYPSLRSFVKEFRGNKIAVDNLNSFFTIAEVPSDDEFRYILSKIPTDSFNKILQNLHHRLERKKRIQPLRLMDKYDLVALDGSGQLSSYKVACAKCLTRISSQDGHEQILYLHSQLVASLISAKLPVSLTMAYEPQQFRMNQNKSKSNQNK